MQHQNGISKQNTKPRGTILLVDDDPAILFIISRFLQKHSYQTTSVTRAENALELVRTTNFDLVACDINMPGMNGLEFLNALKRVDPGLASVVITGSGSVTMAVKAMQSGALGFVTKPFTEEELLDSIETAIQQARLVRETTTFKLYAPMLEGASGALLRALEAKDQNTQGHSQRVADISQHLAHRLGLNQEEMVQIFFGAMFHDIGKIGIPDTILQKTEPLTPEEEQEIRKHTQIGAKIIGTVEKLAMAANVILHHHERYDGKGYPSGLGGEEIPIGSRIVAVVDTYQELISGHINNKAKTSEEALAEIRKVSGTQLDPKIVELFLEFLPQLDTR
ncbi:MAG: HD domain-containing phosphohydrolase [Chloroflexota bacterium]|nr:response regulator [Chloroflexota bacterium]